MSVKLQLLTYYIGIVTGMLLWAGYRIKNDAVPFIAAVGIVAFPLLLYAVGAFH